MKYRWQCTNKDYAEQQAFYQTLMYLQECRKSEEQINIDEVMKYMKDNAKRIFDDLNLDFPDFERGV